MSILKDSDEDRNDDWMDLPTRNLRKPKPQPQEDKK